MEEAQPLFIPWTWTGVKETSYDVKNYLKKMRQEVLEQYPGRDMHGYYTENWLQKNRVYSDDEEDDDD